jgi:hypothetical protein
MRSVPARCCMEQTGNFRMSPILTRSVHFFSATSIFAVNVKKLTLRKTGLNQRMRRPSSGIFDKSTG